MNKHIIYLAAGSGSRFGSNKLLCPLEGKPLFRHGLDTLAGLVRARKDCDLTIVSRYGPVLEAAQAAGADYLGVGAMFPTGTKQDTRPVSYDTLKAICAAVDIPVVAIGGIGAGNVAELAGSGIAGVAVVSALYAQPDVEAATRSLRAQVERVVGP